MSRALKAWLFTNFSKVREARYRCHFAALVINVQTIRNPNGFAKGEVSKKCNGEILNWVNTKTSLCPSFRVTIMDSQQLQINWTTFVTFLWSQPDFFRTTVWNRSIPTYPYYSTLIHTYWYDDISTCKYSKLEWIFPKLHLSNCTPSRTTTTSPHHTAKFWVFGLKCLGGLVPGWTTWTIIIWSTPSLWRLNILQLLDHGRLNHIKT